jgi:sugar transferase (PEP-CTERM/EpsH1 system associated)
MTPHIVHIVHRFDTGGMENGMVNLFNAMPPERYRHTVVALTDYSDFRRRITAQRVDFHALKRPPGNGVGWTVDLWSLLRKLRPDLVHTRNLAALEAQFVTAASGVRATVHGEHGRDVFDLHRRNWKYQLLRRGAVPLVRNYVAVSRDLASWLQRDVAVPAGKIHQIYNGVDSRTFRPRAGVRPDVFPRGFADDDSVVFGSVGRMVEIKDYPTLVRAFIGLLQHQPALARTARLVIVGAGPDRAACQALLHAAGLARYAWLPGERQDVAEVMRAFDVFALVSQSEGISNTILEACATGLPVIVTAVGGNVELIEEGVNGTLVGAGDVAGIARAMRRYLESPDLRAEVGRMARQAAEQRYSIPAMCASYADVYDRTLAGRWQTTKNMDVDRAL